MEELFNQLVADVAACPVIESLVCGKGVPKPPKTRARKPVRGRQTATAPPITPTFNTNEAVARVVTECRSARKRNHPAPAPDTGDDAICKYARFTDGSELKSFEHFLHYVPRLVNVVTLAEAVPVPGSGLKLPLDLNYIASRCTGAYFAPKRFAAVQLAYTHPRARVLIFHTGRLVGTGTSGRMAARLAIARAQRQLSMEAGVHLQTRNFNVINQVGAVSLSATLECNQFANAHPHDSHYDQQSFVGLAWRPANEDICCEVYSTGRANLPGSVTERQLNTSWARMLPELLRFSSRSRLLEIIPEHIKSVHRTSMECSSRSSRPTLGADSQQLMEGWVTSTEGVVEELNDEEDEEEDGQSSGSADELDEDTLANLGL